MGYSVSPSTIPCGPVTFTVTNNGDTQHDFQIEGLVGAATRLLAPGDKVAMTATVPPGTWTYFCSFPNHRSLGMQGQLTVTG
jgi:plastocyanin